MATHIGAGDVRRGRGPRWWWLAPQSRCVGLRQRRQDRHCRVRMVAGLSLAVLLLLVAVLHESGTGALVVESVGSTRALWLLLALTLQAGSMATFARLQRRVLADAGLELPLTSALAIVYAGNAVSVTIPFAGSTASAAFTYQQYVRRGASGPMAGWALTVAGVFSTVTFALLIGAGGIANGNPIAAGAGIASIAIVVVPLTIVALAVRRAGVRGRLEPFVARVLALTKRLIGRPRGEPADVVSRGMGQLASYRIGRRHALIAAWFAAMNWILDALCLWAVLQAFNVSMPVRNLPLVYAAAIAAASLGFTPAGIGTVEAAIAVALSNLGSDGAHALPAAVVYRGISTWLVLLIGWCVMVVLRRRGRVPEPLPSG